MYARFFQKRDTLYFSRVLGYPFWMLFWEDILYFASETHGAFSFKQILYEGVTVFNVYFSLKFEKKIYDNKCERENCVISAAILAF